MDARTHFGNAADVARKGSVPALGAGTAPSMTETKEWKRPDPDAKYTIGVDWAEGHCLTCGQILPLKCGRPRGRLAQDSPDTVAAILELNKAGLSLRDIGARMRMSKDWVRRILNRHKEPPMRSDQ